MDAVYFFDAVTDSHAEVQILRREQMKKIILVAALTLVSASVASAATSTGALTVTGTVESSINLTIESAGGSTSGTGTAAVTSALGTISKYSSAPTGFTMAQGASNWTISSTIGVKVLKSNLAATTYLLEAELATAPDTGIVWQVNGATLSESAPATIAATASFGSTDVYSWDIVVADSAAAAAIDNTVNFTATSN
jgi:hypothetical protein